MKDIICALGGEISLLKLMLKEKHISKKKLKIAIERQEKILYDIEIINNK